MVATGQTKRAVDSPRRYPTPTSLTLVIDDAGPAHGNVLHYHQDGGRHLPRRVVVLGTATVPLPAAAQEQLDLEAAAYVADMLGRI